ncbi:odorant receptor 9a-like [Cotesia glomerata]|uniref:odorant receptor 9a-like n=1 Tax=Cotesia glomerata TaxID=32391 RepID=UPI001D00A95B|nr:odorant receptor 9a-like [Cotesia glomerata]
MDIFDQPCYKTTKNLASVIGRWPYQPQKQSSIIILVLWIALALQTIPQIIAMFIYYDDSDVLFEALSVILVDIVLAAKYLNASYRAELIKTLFDKVQMDWKLLKNEEERRILQYHADIGRFLSAGYIAFLFASSVIFVTEPLVPRIYSYLSTSNGSVPLLFAFPAEFVLFEKEDHYWLMLVVTSTLTLVVVVGVISCDVIFITLLQHICGLFAVLGHRIEHIPTGDFMKENRKENCISLQKNDRDISYQHLVSCVELHSRAIKFAELLETCFALSFGVVVGLNLPMISITGFQVITRSNTVQQILKCISFTGAQILHLFFDCYLSQKLNDSSSQICHCIANVKWYNHSVKSQKLLVVMTMRSQVPCKLTAGKMMELSIENYGMMLKTAGSYFTMLLSMQ